MIYYRANYRNHARHYEYGKKKKKKRVGNEGFQDMDLRKIQEIMNTMFSCVV